MASYVSDGLTLAYDDIPAQGAAAGVALLVHGFASNRVEGWKRMSWYAAFERGGYRLLAADLRGHGQSAKPHASDAYARRSLLGDLIALMDHAGVRRAHVVGYSMGAHLSLALALSAPERVDKLVLGGVGARLLGEGPARPAPAMSIAEALLTEDPSAIADPTQRGFRRFAEQQGDDRAALAACAGGQGEPVTRERLERLSAPTLVVAGAQDELAGDPRVLAEALPDGRAVVLPGCDHFSAIPHALFKASVFDFLDDYEEPPPWE